MKKDLLHIFVLQEPRISINPWGEGVYIPKDLLRFILEQKRKGESEESLEEEE